MLCSPLVHLVAHIDNFQQCLPTDHLVQQRYRQSSLKATGLEPWKFRRTTSCRHRQSLSSWPCKAAVPRPFARHARNFYCFHMTSTESASQGSECLPPARSESARVPRSSYSGITIPTPCSSVSGCGRPLGSKLLRSERSSAPFATSFAITLTACASDSPSHGIRVASMSALLPSITTPVELQ